MAHELRNPLNVVKTSAYYLLNARNAKPEKVAEHLRRIEQQVAVADGVITALSNFAIMPLPSATFFCRCCVREALDANPQPANVVVELDFPTSLPLLLATSIKSASSLAT